MGLYKRGKVYWFSFIFDGRHIQKSTKTANKAAARDIEAGYRIKLAKGEVGIEEKKPVPHFREAMKDFLEWSKHEHANKPNTYIRYKTSSKVLSQFFKDSRLDKIEIQDVEKFKVWRSKQKCKTKAGKILNRQIKPATVNRELACLKKLFNRYKSFVPRNPVSEVKFLAENNEQLRVITFEEEAKYLAEASQPLKDVAILMIQTGARPEEISRLKIQNVNFERGYLSVDFGKTKASRRKIPLTKIASNVLRNRINQAKGEYLFAGGRGGTNLQKPIIKLNNAHKGTIERAKLEPFRIYQFRHTFATRAVEAGIDLATLATLLGHSRLQMVMRYAHPSEEHQFNAMKRIERFTVSKTKTPEISKKK